MKQRYSHLLAFLFFLSISSFSFGMEEKCQKEEERQFKVLMKAILTNPERLIKFIQKKSPKFARRDDFEVGNTCSIRASIFECVSCERAAEDSYELTFQLKGNKPRAGSGEISMEILKRPTFKTNEKGELLLTYKGKDYALIKSDVSNGYCIAYIYTETEKVCSPEGYTHLLV